MITAHAYGSLTWIDVLNPTQDEIMALARRYHLSLVIADELSRPSYQSKVESTPDMLYLVLHFPGMNDHAKAETRHEQEIDCVVGHEFLITVRYAPIDSVLEFEKFITTKNMLNRQEDTASGVILLYHLIRIFYRNLEKYNSDVAQTLKDIETKIFSDDEDRMVRVISNINRKIIEQRRSLILHDMALTDALHYARTLFSAHDHELLKQLHHTFEGIQTLLQNNKDILDDLRDTNALLLNTKTNNIMKILTIITFISLPLLFGVEILRKPLEDIAHTPISIALVLLATVSMAGMMYGFFKYKRWV